LAGSTDRPEFRAARAGLDALGEVTSVPDADSAAALLEGAELVPELIVVAQAYPSQFPQEAIDRLRCLCPLSRVLGLMGSWCEGEMRTGRPWPGSIRIYWHQWLPQCGRQLACMARNECSVWDLPVTATEEERLLLAAEQPLPDCPGLVAIYSHRYEMGDWLSAALRSRGCSTVWLRPPHPARVEGAAAAVFDGSELRGEQLDELKQLSTALTPAPILALLSFPRIEDHRRARRAGAAAVLSKPLQLGNLFWELDRALNTPADG